MRIFSLFTLPRANELRNSAGFLILEALVIVVLISAAIEALARFEYAGRQAEIEIKSRRRDALESPINDCVDSGGGALVFLTCKRGRITQTLLCAR